MDSGTSQSYRNGIYIDKNITNNNSTQCSYKSFLHCGYFVANSPCYSSCGRYVFIANSSTVYICQAKHFVIRKTLSFSASIITFSIYSGASDYLFVLLENKRIFIYKNTGNYTDFDRVSELKLPDFQPIDLKISKLGAIFLVTRLDEVRIYKLNHDLAETSTEPIEVSEMLEPILKFDSDITCFAISYNGDFIAVSISKLVIIVNVTDLSKSALSALSFPNQYQITTLAFHPKNEYIAAGDNKGRVTTWILAFDKNVFISPKNLSAKSVGGLNSLKMSISKNATVSPREIVDKLLSDKTDVVINKEVKFTGVFKSDVRVLHWHAHSINTLVFTQCGRFMLTGGEEAVVVIWDLKAETKRFITRLESTIFHIAISSKDGIATQYLVACSDNSLKAFDPILLIMKSVTYGIHVPLGMCISNYRESSDSNIACFSPSKFNIYFKYIPKLKGIGNNRGVIALSISGLKLQLFPLGVNGLISQVDFLDSNYVSRFQEEFGSSYLVEEMCISRDCKWIVASSARKLFSTAKKGKDEERRILRFWGQKPSSTLIYSISQQVNNSHTGRVLKILELSKNKFVTLAMNEWICWSYSDKWACTARGSLKEFKNLAMSRSLDQSLVAVSHGDHISFWSTDDWSLLLHKKLYEGQSVNWLYFVGQQYLLTGTESHVSTWDLHSDLINAVYTHREEDCVMYDIVYDEQFPNLIAALSTDKRKRRSKIILFLLNSLGGFKPVWNKVEEFPNIFIKAMFFKAEAEFTLLGLLLGNLEIQTYSIQDEDCDREVGVTPFALNPLEIDADIKEDHDVTLEVGLSAIDKHITRPSLVRPFDESCPTFALPSPAQAFKRMAKSLLNKSK